MTFKSLVAAIVLGLSTIASAVAAPYTPATTIPNVAALKAGNFGSVQAPYLNGYYTYSDGGQGSLQFFAGPCVEDGGYVLKDGAGNCFRRSNLNGDLRQYGATTGSVYDMQAHPTTVTSASAIMNAAYSAINTLGMKTVSTGQVSIYLATTVDIPNISVLDCNLPSGGPVSNGHYNALPATIALAHGAMLHMPQTSDSVTIQNCIIIPQMLNDPTVVSAWGGYAFSYPGNTDADLENLRGNMIKAGDTAILLGDPTASPPAGSKGDYLNNVYIYGFDNCLNALKADHLFVDKMRGDCNIGVYGKNGGGQSDLSDVQFEPFLTRVPVSANFAPVVVPNNQNWSITAIGQSPTLNTYGRPECRLTLATTAVSHVNPDGSPIEPVTSALDAQGDPITYPMWLANMTSATVAGTRGGLACAGNGPYAITVISASPTAATVDLNGSDFGTGAFAVTGTATWTAGSPVLKILSTNLNALTIGETIADTAGGANGIPVGAKLKFVVISVKGPDPNDAGIAEVVMDQPATVTQTAATALTFDGGTFLASSDPCNAAHAGFCAFINASERVHSGNSDAGNSSALLPLSEGRHFAAGFFSNGVAGFRATNTFADNYHYGYAMQDSPNCSFVQLHADENGELDDIDRISTYMSGSTKCTILANGNGQSGRSEIVDLYTTADTNHTSTLSSGISTGLGSIAVASTAAFGSIGDTWNFGICQNFSTVCTNLNQHPEEYITATITDATHLNVIARGQFFTAIASHLTSDTVVRTAIGSTTGMVSFTSLSAPAEQSSGVDFEVAHGGFSETNVRVLGTARYGYFSHNTTDAFLISDLMPTTAMVYEDETARANVVLQNNCGADCPDVRYPYQPSGAAQTATGWTVLGAHGLGLLGMTNTNWPQQGTIGKVDNEYFWFTISNFGIAVESRGACGSTPAAHLDGAVTTFYNFISCPVTGTPNSTNNGTTGNWDFQFQPDSGTTPLFLSQFGARVLSVDDFGAVGDGATNDSPAFAAAIAAAVANNISTVYVVRNARYYLATGVSVPKNITLKAYSSRSDIAQNASNVATGDHKNYPYTLLIPQTATVTVSSGGTSGVIDGFVVENKAVYDTPNPTSTVCCLQQLNTTVAAFGGTGVTFAGDGASFLNGMVLGFAVGISSTGFDSVQIRNAYVDATKCILIKNSNLIEGLVANTGCYSILTAQMAAGFQHIDITAIADSGGHPQLTLSCADATNNCPRTGDQVWIGAPPGSNYVVQAEMVQGECTYNRISDVLATCSNINDTPLVTTGTLAQNSCEITGIVDPSRARFGQGVTGTNIPVGATVAASWVAQSIVWLDSAHCATASGAIANLTFTDQGYVYSSPTNVLAVQPFPSYRSGVGIDVDNDDGFHFTDCAVYTHKIAVQLHNGSANNSFVGCAYNDEHNQQATDRAGIEIDDSSKGNVFYGGKLAYGGNGSPAFLNNQTSNVSFAPNMFFGGSVVGFDQVPYLDDRGGNLVFQPTVSGATTANVFVSNGVNNLDFLNTSTTNRTSFWFQDATALANTCMSNVTQANAQMSATALLQCPESVAGALVAFVGGGQASATPITTAMARFSGVANDHDSAMLPVAVAGIHVFVVNAGNHLLDVYGNITDGGQINLGGAGVPVSMPAKTGTNAQVWEFISTGTGRWSVTTLSAVATGGSCLNLSDGTTGCQTPIDNDPTLAANSATRTATQQATKTYADTKLAKASNLSDVANPITSINNLLHWTSVNAAQFDKTNTTPAGVTGLSMTAASGKTYSFHVLLHITADATSGLRVRMGGTTTATSDIYAIQLVCEGSTTAIAPLRVQDWNTAILVYTAGCTTVRATLDGSIVVNAGGTITPQFALGSGTTLGSVLAGSSMTVDQVN